MGAGTLFASYVSNAAIEVAGGMIGLSFVLYRWLGRWLWPHLVRAAEKPKQPYALAGVFWGSLAGFMSLLVNVGAPPYQIHILPQRLDKLTFVGTTVMFFAFMNLMKIGPYFLLGQFSLRNFATSAALWPLAVAANYLGIWLVRRTPTEPFYRITLSADVCHFAGADLAGLARAEAGRLTNYSPLAIRPCRAFG